MTNLTQAPPPGTIQKPQTLKDLLNDVNVKKRFEEIMGRRAGAFMSNLLSVSQGSANLQEASPGSIIASAMKAAALDLPIEPSLGMAAIVPYKEKEGGSVAQFQIMWRGFVQLALRTGKYEQINLARVYEGQLVSHDEFTGEVKLDAKAKKSDRVQGYFFFFKLVNGYRRAEYWSAQKCMEHGKQFSKAFYSGKWTEDAGLPRDEKSRFLFDKWDGFLTKNSGSDAMSAKTIVKMTLSKWGLLSVEMQDAQKSDQAVIDERGNPRYIDGTVVPEADAPKTFSEPKELPQQATAHEGEVAEFKVKRASKSDLAGQECFVIVDTGEKDKAVKYFTDKEGNFNLAKVAVDAGSTLRARWVPKKVGDVEVRWLNHLEPKLNS